MVTDLLKKSGFLVKENASLVLTAAGVVGTASTAFLTGRATVQAVRVVDDAVSDPKVRLPNYANGETDIVEVPPTKFDLIKMVWPLYIPPFGVGAATIASIVMANRISSKKAAAMAAAYGISERAFQEYKDKVVEKLGVSKERTARDELAQERVAANPPGSRELILAGTGEVLCMDLFTGRYFQSTVEEIKRAQNKINSEIINHQYASLSSFYDEIGLPATEMSDSLGWNSNHGLIEVQFSTTMAQDTSGTRPCIAISFIIPPIAEYAKMWG